MWVTIVIVFVCLCLAYKCACDYYLPSFNKFVPVHPGKSPVIGHTHLFLKVDELFKTVQSLGQYCLDNGGVSQFLLGPMPIYVITDPEDVSTVLNKCLDKMFVYKFIRPMLGNVLVAADVPSWKRNRRILDLGFKQYLLDDYLDLFNSQADRLTQSLAEEIGKGNVDLTEKLTKSILETTCRTTMGTSVDGEDLVDDKYVLAVHELLELITVRVVNPWLMSDFLFNRSSYKKRWQNAFETVIQLSERLVRLRISEHLERLKNNQEFNYKKRKFQSVLDILVENTISQAGSVFTESELRNFVDNILLAAFDTTIYEMLYVLVCIGTYPEVQDKIYQEIIQVLGNDGKPSKENLSQLVYLEAAIKEAIRLYPIGPVVARQATTDTQLRNVTIPSGSSIVVHLWAVNRNPKYWGTDANEFRPERWLNPSTSPDHPAAYASFSPGRRNCVGKPYAIMYIKATLVPLLRKFKLNADHTKMKFDCKIMIKPKSGHLVTVENR